MTAAKPPTFSPASWSERLIGAADLALRTVFAPAHGQRPSPTAGVGAVPATPSVLNAHERRQVVGMMRVNHAGEICAQALYSGQALATQNAQLRTHLAQAGAEEIDHLAWTEQRLADLGAQPSLLKPFWYAGAFVIGFCAAKLGDDWSLGFVAETERQVGAHLQGHLARLPEQDEASRRILQQMQAEETAHREHAIALGARELPAGIRWAMKAAAKVMTQSAARL